jgi:hypothetical protein
LKGALSTKAELLPRIHALLGRIYGSQRGDQQAIDEPKFGPVSDDGSVHFHFGCLLSEEWPVEFAEAAFEETPQASDRRLITKTLSAPEKTRASVPSGGRRRDALLLLKRSLLIKRSESMMVLPVDSRRL